MSAEEEDLNKLPELTPMEEVKLRELYNKIDKNRDGKIDIKDLSTALSEMEVAQLPGHAQDFFARHDTNKDGQITFAEFVEFITEHEKRLHSYFQKIDVNRDGSIDVSEIMQSFQKLGVKIEKKEAEKLMQRMDKDGSLKINWHEWRDYLILSSGIKDLKDILHYWRHATIIDIGENGSIPDDFTEKEMQTGMWWRHLVSGGIAGAVSRTATAPLDRIKIFLQVHGSKNANFGVVNGLQYMLKEGGVKSLWRGNFINVLKIAPESALKFMAYEQFKSMFKGDRQDVTILERLMSGSLAGATAQTIIYPMEVLKTRLALRKTGQFDGIVDCAKKVCKAEGAQVFYRGYVPNILGIIPYAGIDLAIYETLKQIYTKKTHGSDPGIFALLACGTISSTCGQLASYPLALVRTRLQAQIRKEQNIKREAHDTMTGMFKNIIKQDGLIGLYRGLAPNFLKVLPAVSISYVVYEETRKALGVKMS